MEYSNEIYRVVENEDGTKDLGDKVVLCCVRNDDFYPEANAAEIAAVKAIAESASELAGQSAIDAAAAHEAANLAYCLANGYEEDIQRALDAAEAAKTAAENVDLSSKVSKSGDTMTGALTTTAVVAEYNGKADSNYLELHIPGQTRCTFSQDFGGTHEGELKLNVSATSTGFAGYTCDFYWRPTGEVGYGELLLPNLPKTPATNAAVPLSYLDEKVGEYLPLSGGTLTGELKVLRAVSMSAGESNSTGQGYPFDFYFGDNLIGKIFVRRDVTGENEATDSNTFWIRAYHDTDKTKFAQLVLRAHSDGTSYLQASNPPENAYENAIMTKKSCNSDYLRLDGTGNPVTGYNIQFHAPQTSGSESVRQDVIFNISPPDDYVANNHGMILAQNLYYDSTESDPTGIWERRSLFFNLRNKDTGAISGGIGVAEDNKGRFFCRASNPREGMYTPDVDTLQSSINRHPVHYSQLFPGSVIYVGGDNASDTEDLWKGRGTSDKPFATLESALAFLKLLDGTGVDVTIHLQANVTLSSSPIVNLSGFRGLTINSSSPYKTLSASTVRSIRFISTNVTLYQINISNLTFSLEDHSRMEMWACSIACAGASKYQFTVNNSHLDIGSNMSASGNIAAFVNVENSGIVTLASNSTFSRSVSSGKRYVITSFGKIFSGGLGANALPGTTAGTTDSSGQYV